MDLFLAQVLSSRFRLAIRGNTSHDRVYRLLEARHLC